MCRTATGLCDQEEVCSGGNDCPPDGFLSNGTPCDNGVACDGTSDTCDGGGQCVGANPSGCLSTCGNDILEVSARMIARPSVKRLFDPWCVSLCACCVRRCRVRSSARMADPRPSTAIAATPTACGTLLVSHLESAYAAGTAEATSCAGTTCSGMTQTGMCNGVCNGFGTCQFALGCCTSNAQCDDGDQWYVARRAAL